MKKNLCDNCKKIKECDVFRMNVNKFIILKCGNYEQLNNNVEKNKQFKTDYRRY